MEPTTSPRRPRRANADYRWTMPKVATFLDALAACGSVAEAARQVGMGRQSAYRLRARLEETRFGAAFENARRAGLRARAAASAARGRSEWDGPMLGAYLAGLAAQGDSAAAQGDRDAAQGDVRTGHGDSFPRKGTERPLDSVTGVTAPHRAPAFAADADPRGSGRNRGNPPLLGR